MRPYETMIVFDPQVDAQNIQASLDKGLDVIRNFGGAVGSIDRWGKRPLAYEINKRKEAYYVVVGFSGIPATVAELDRVLGLADEILRFKIVRLAAKKPAKAVTASA